jgi:branched-chain amino acid transport system substrate-binding protein
LLQNKMKLFVVAGAALVMAAAGCSSSSKSAGGTGTTTGGTTAGTTAGTTGGSTAGSTGGSAGGSSRTYTVGLLYDHTGPSAPGALSFESGVKAGVLLAAKEGYTIKYVVADTGSTPTGALTAAQKLVLEDHVFAVLADSGATFGAAPFLRSKGVPVIGANQDGSEWTTDPNMFSIAGTSDYTQVYTQTGLQFKGLGATNIAAVGYAGIPSSADTAKSTAISSQLAGIKVGYLNANLPLGISDVGPDVLAMKAAGVDGLTAALTANTTFAIVQGLRQQGVHLKVALLDSGYGGDLTSGGPGFQQIGQGLYFLTAFEPVELHTPATEQFSSYLNAAGVSGEPTQAEVYGYQMVDAFVQGLKAAGSSATPASLISAMLQIHNYNGAGLYGTHSVSFALADRGKVSAADNCNWVTQYEGHSFIPVPNMSPVCGTTVPGKKV